MSSFQFKKGTRYNLYDNNNKNCVQCIFLFAIVLGYLSATFNETECHTASTFCLLNANFYSNVVTMCVGTE